MLTISRACRKRAATSLLADSFRVSLARDTRGTSDLAPLIVSTMPTNACNYQRVHTRVPNYCWRRKWAFLIALTSCIVIIVLFTGYPTIREASTAEHDTYLDDVPEDLYQSGIRIPNFHSFLNWWKSHDQNNNFFLSLLQCYKLGTTFPTVSDCNKLFEIFIRRYMYMYIYIFVHWIDDM